MIDDFEKQLQAALAKKEPSPFFEARVLAAAKRQVHARKTSFRLRWVSAIAAALLVMSGSAYQYEKAHQERAAGEDAKARLELALKITSVKLQKISIRIEEIQQN